MGWFNSKKTLEQRIDSRVSGLIMTLNSTTEDQFSEEEKIEIVRRFNHKVVHRMEESISNYTTESEALSTKAESIKNKLKSANLVSDTEGKNNNEIGYK